MLLVCFVWGTIVGMPEIFSNHYQSRPTGYIFRDKIAVVIWKQWWEAMHYMEIFLWLRCTMFESNCGKQCTVWISFCGEFNPYHKNKVSL